VDPGGQFGVEGVEVRRAGPSKDLPNPGTVFGVEIAGVVAPEVNLLATLSGGGLSEELQYQLSLSASNLVSVLGDAARAKMRLTFTPATGALVGSFVNPETGMTATINGVVFQKQQIAGGNFLSPAAQTGSSPRVGRIQLSP
jgi:hypothetical protein